LSETFLILTGSERVTVLIVHKPSSKVPVTFVRF